MNVKSSGKNKYIGNGTCVAKYKRLTFLLNFFKTHIIVYSNIMGLIKDMSNLQFRYDDTDCLPLFLPGNHNHKLWK